LTHSTDTSGHLLPDGTTEQVQYLHGLLAQLDGETDEEHAERRRRLADAIRSVLDKHAA
jgi:hypothetical protein